MRGAERRRRGREGHGGVGAYVREFAGDAEGIGTDLLPGRHLEFFEEIDRGRAMKPPNE